MKLVKNVPEIVRLCLEEMFQIQRDIDESIWLDPARCFEPVELKTQGKTACVADVAAEFGLACGFRRRLKAYDPLVIGEETIGLARPHHFVHDGVLALVDAIDGTRLLERGQPGWCSAVTLLRPRKSELLGAAVTFPSGRGFYASAGGAGECKWDGQRIDYRPVSGTSQRVRLSEASIAFYGYRFEKFATVGRQIAEAIGPCSARTAEIFVVGGNPALAGIAGPGKTIHAVIEPLGQLPHDMLAGAYICRQAGGVILNLNGTPIDLEALIKGDLTARVKYVAAANCALALEICEALSKVSLRPVGDNKRLAA